MMESSQNENVPLSITPEKEGEDLLSLSVEEGGFYDDDDEVFLDDIQSLEMASSSGIPSRVRERRTSDVIDSVGEATSPAHIKRHSFPSTSGEVYSATSRVMIIKDTNRSRRAELTSELVDQGYSSPGAQSSARSLRESWFQYSTITTNNDADAIDAKPMTSQSETKSSYVLNVPNKITEMVVSKDAICYNMDHQYRGLAVIINNDIFERTSLPDRIGSLKDVNDLTSVFFEMHFEVLVWNNLYQDEIHERIKKLALEDHSKNDCLIVVVMTHGMTSSFVYARENPYPVENLWEAFTPDKCPTLAGKPKMFFVQACRGEKLDCGVTLYKEITQVDSSSPTYKLPTYADFMIAFSTYDGYYSFRHPDNGTWFIQSLCFELNKHDLTTTDMLTIMTRVSRRVALDYESYHPVKSWLHQQKQIPVVHSMLIRDVFFKPKKFPPPEPVFIEGR